jgi:hypothetical protein
MDVPVGCVWLSTPSFGQVVVPIFPCSCISKVNVLEIVFTVFSHETLAIKEILLGEGPSIPENPFWNRSLRNTASSLDLLIKRWVLLCPKPKPLAQKVKHLAQVCAFMAQILQMLRNDRKIKPEGVDKLQHRFELADPMVDLSLEAALKAADKNFDPYNLQFVATLETEAIPVGSDGTAASSGTSSEDDTLKLYERKLAEDKAVWIKYLHSHSSTIEESAAKQLEHKRNIKAKGFAAARHLLGFNDGEAAPVRCLVVEEDDTNPTQYMREVADYQRQIIIKHGNYKLMTVVSIVDCQQLRRWAMDLEKCISLTKFNDNNMGIVLMPWGDGDADMMGTMMSMP